MGFKWLKVMKGNLVVGFPFLLAWESIICFVDIDEFLFGILIVRILFRVIFQGQFSIGFLNLVKRSMPWYSKNLIIVFHGVRIVLRKKILFLFILNSKLVVKVLKSFLSLVNRELSFDEMIVMRLFGSVS
jgi:hypothetical protein